MKKSKIIVPALGILAFSTAAAVTGTVAWFTANRQATISNTAMVAFNPEAGLNIKLVNPSAGVTLTTAGPGQAVSAAHKDLRDGSVDIHTDTHKVFGSNLGADGQLDPTNPYKLIPDSGATAGYEAGTKINGTKYYYANKYEAQFELAAANSQDSYGILFDNTKTSTAGSVASDIQNALRIGFRCNDTDKFFVVAPFRTAMENNYTVASVADATEYDTKKSNLYTRSGTPGAYTYTPVGSAAYVPDTTYYEILTTSESYVDSASSVGSYHDNIIHSGINNASGIGGSVDAESAFNSTVGYLGKISGVYDQSTNPGGRLTATVFTWFEGCDPDCINGNVDANALVAALTFRIVKIG